MNSIRSCFNEVAALTAGFHGAATGIKLGIDGCSMLMAATGLGTVTGVVPTVIALTAVAAMCAVGAAIGYKGAKALLSSIQEEVEPSDTRRCFKRRACGTTFTRGCAVGVGPLRIGWTTAQHMPTRSRSLPLL